MDILGFYKKGARVVVRGSGSDRSKRFSAGVGDVELGVVPSENARKVTGPAFDIIQHRGIKHLILNAGHVYNVMLKIGDVEKHDVVTAEYGFVALALPKDAVVVSVEAVVEPEQDSVEE